MSALVVVAVLRGTSAAPAAPAAPVAPAAPAPLPPLPSCCKPELHKLRFSKGKLAVAHKQGDRILYLALGECGTGFDRCAGFHVLDGTWASVGGGQVVQLSGKPSDPAPVPGSSPSLLAQAVPIASPLSLDHEHGVQVEETRPSGERTVQCTVRRRLAKKEGPLSSPRFPLSSLALVVEGPCALVGAAGGSPVTILVDGEVLGGTKVAKDGVTTNALASLAALEATATAHQLVSSEGLISMLARVPVELVILEAATPTSTGLRRVRVQRTADRTQRGFALVDVAEVLWQQTHTRRGTCQWEVTMRRGRVTTLVL